MQKKLILIAFILTVVSFIYAYDLRDDIKAECIGMYHDLPLVAIYDVNHKENKKTLFADTGPLFFDGLLIEKRVPKELKISDVIGLSNSEKRILRNYYYALHGYIFNSEILKSYFSKYSWYDPVESDSKRIEEVFTEEEKASIKLIKHIEANPEIYNPQGIYDAVLGKDLKRLSFYVENGILFNFVYQDTTPLLIFLDPDKSHDINGDINITGDGEIDEVDQEIIKYLILNKADQNYNPNHAGWSPFFLILLHTLNNRYFYAYDFFDYCAEIRSKSNRYHGEVFDISIDVKYQPGNLHHHPLELAAAYGRLVILQILIKHTNTIGGSIAFADAFVKAVKADQLESARMLAQSEIKVFHHHTDYVIKSNKIEFFKMLMDVVDSEMRNYALVNCAFLGMREHIKVLMEYDDIDLSESAYAQSHSNKAPYEYNGPGNITAIEADERFQNGKNSDLLKK